MKLKLVFLIVFSFLFFGNNSTFAQKSKRQRLEARRTQLQKDIVYINALLSNTKRKEKNLLSEVKDLNHKINKRGELISAIEAESNELGNEIYTNQLTINKNKRELAALKEDYGNMIYKSYKSKSTNSRMMFLLSSDNFFQAYKRFQYMKQYTQFRKKQGDEITKKTEQIQSLVDSLQIKKQQKQLLLNEKKEEQTKIENERKLQEKLLGQVKNKERKYKKQIKGFEREQRRVNAQIDKLIKEAIAASNKKAGNKSGSSTFALTAEAKALAS
ncbi:MAG TPA: hypothetical protein VJ970_01095, partial [Flavobacteriaceae bacterium]|nr:hypothetical protein [Flavobacteriaceae bacterium]